MAAMNERISLISLSWFLDRWGSTLSIAWWSSRTVCTSAICCSCLEQKEKNILLWVENKVWSSMKCGNYNIPHSVKVKGQGHNIEGRRQKAASKTGNSGCRRRFLVREQRLKSLNIVTESPNAAFKATSLLELLYILLYYIYRRCLQHASSAAVYILFYTIYFIIYHYFMQL